jgi:hypothetical protein
VGLHQAGHAVRCFGDAAIAHDLAAAAVAVEVVAAEDPLSTFIARWLVQAENHCIYPQRGGRDPAAVAELVRLAELLAIPVMDSRVRDSVNVPGSHPLYGTGPASTAVDVALVLENVRPSSPGLEDPPATAKIAWVDADPVQSRFKTMEFRADLWLPAHVGATVRAGTAKHRCREPFLCNRLRRVIHFTTSFCEDEMPTESSRHTLRLWAFGDAHVGTDKRNGRDSLAEAIIHSESGGTEGGPPFAQGLAIGTDVPAPGPP